MENTAIISIILAILIILVFLFVLTSLLKTIKRHEKNNLELQKTVAALETNLNTSNTELSQVKNDYNLLQISYNELETGYQNQVQKAELILQDKELLQKDLNQVKEQMLQSENLVQEKEAKIEETKAKLLIDQQEFNTFVNEEHAKLAKANSEIHEKQQELQQQSYEMRLKLDQVEVECKEKLMQVASLDEETAKEIVLDEARINQRDQISKEISLFENKLRLEKKDIALDIILSTMQNLLGEPVNEHFSKIIKLPNEEIKGRLIGRDGRNINLLQNLLGVNIVIDETPEQFMISSFNPVRRAVASLTFDRLITSGKINQAEIEETHRLVEKEINDLILEKGKEAVKIFGITDMHSALIEKIGILYFRTSYGQNMYQHSIEVAKICFSIANQLGLDAQMAARCGLLHDVGKVDSEEVGLSHVELGVSLANQYGEPKEVVNAIAAHHGDVDPDNMYAEITIIADSLSAAQLGARRDTSEVFIQRVEALEEIALSIPGVNKAYALKGGKELRIIVEPGKVRDNQLKALAQEVKGKVEGELSLPAGLSVVVLRENRYIVNAKKNKSEE